MRLAVHIIGTKRLRDAAFVLFLSVIGGAIPGFAATVQVRWASNSEADLAGYRLRFGTEPGTYTQTIDAGPSTLCEVSGLDPGRMYYFALFAYDEAGNESAPSAEVTARVPPDLAPIPVVRSAIEASSRSIYALRGQPMLVLVYGNHFQADASVDLGPDILVGTVSRTTGGDLLARADITAGAGLGGRTVTVSNPDQGVGSRSDTLTVVKNPDINADCSVDIVDLNTLARAWNETGDEARYIPGADFDGDGYIGPEDLTILVQFFGRAFTGCP